MKEDIFVVSGAMGKALATKAAGKKTVSQDSKILDLHGGVQDVFWGRSNLFSGSERKTCDGQGLFMFPETSGLSPEEKEEKEKEHQERRMKQMAMYQSYHALIWDEEYAPRGSKMTCSYGTKTALLDTLTDHGVYMGSMSVMTCMDCRKWNLHDFGSCMSPENLYKERVDMTVPVRNGRTAQKAPWNQYPHICVPLVDEKQGWHQTIGEVWIKNEEGEAERVLVRRAFLVCRYGGIITIPETVRQYDRKKVMDILRIYLKEGKFEEDEVELALQFLALDSSDELYKYSSNKDRDYNRYDTYILGWCEYYKEEMGVAIDSNYMKSMMYEESRVGYGADKGVPTDNFERDVVQALDIKNDNIFNYIKIPPNQLKAETSIYGYWDLVQIRTINKAGLPGEPMADKQARCGGIIRTLFNTEKDGSGICYVEGSVGTYYLLLEDVTPIMSIGIAAETMQGLLTKHNYDYYKALEEYNQGNPKYASEVIERVELVKSGGRFEGD